MTILSFIPINNWIFWRGFLLATCLWLCVLNLSLWYWRMKIKELAALIRRVVEPDQQATDGEAG